MPCFLLDLSHAKRWFWSPNLQIPATLFSSMGGSMLKKWLLCSQWKNDEAANYLTDCTAPPNFCFHRIWGWGGCVYNAYFIYKLAFISKRWPIDRAGCSMVWPRVEQTHSEQESCAAAVAHSAVGLDTFIIFLLRWGCTLALGYKIGGSQL